MFGLVAMWSVEIIHEEIGDMQMVDEKGVCLIWTWSASNVHTPTYGKEANEGEMVALRYYDIAISTTWIWSSLSLASGLIIYVCVCVWSYVFRE